MAKVGDVISLQKQDVKIVECEDCKRLMVNIDANEIKEGDLVTLKRLGIRISNPETPDPICVNCEVEKRPTFREKVSSWFNSGSNDDGGFFSSGSFGGGVSSGGFGGGGFGGFGGGSFSGGGASRGF